MIRALLVAAALLGPGHSVQGRPIEVLERGDLQAAERVLVVGCIHGDECAGMAIVRRLERLRVPPGIELVLVPTLNPDGLAAGTRGNAHGVDLNRQFPWRWKATAQGTFYSGPKPLSEPESRFAYALLRRLRPDLTVWYHQHLALVVREPGGDLALERRYAELSGLPLRWLGRFSGSVAAWQNAAFPHTASFVVELPAGRLTPAEVERHVRALVAIAT